MLLLTRILLLLAVGLTNFFGRSRRARVMQKKGARIATAVGEGKGGALLLLKVAPFEIEKPLQEGL